jgi:hypothetical protein
MLLDVANPIPYLQVFAERYRNGTLAPSNQPTKSRTVEAALRSVAQTISLLGAPDPRLTPQGKMHYRLQQQLKGYSKLDTPPSRVKPIPFQIINHMNTTSHTTMDSTAADLATIGFFFLLRPGEHTRSTKSNDTHPFRLQDVTFRAGAVTFSAATGPLDTIPHATFVTLTFTRQKNGVENEVIGHARSGHLHTCPVRALVRRTLHLRHHDAPPTTPLCTVYLPNHILAPITSSHLTTALRRSAHTLFPTIGFPPADISARSLRAGGAMALLCAKVDTNIIKLLGRWRSDEMLRYLHLQAYPQMHTFSPLMTSGGAFRLLTKPPLPHTVPTQNSPNNA